MKADTPSIESLRTWNVTSNRLYRFTMRRLRGVPSSVSRTTASISAANRARPNRSAWRRIGGRIERGDRWRGGRRRQTPRGRPRRRGVRFPPATTVSSAPPRAYATTGRPHACASSGTMPKSSSPGSITTAARRYSSRTSSLRAASEKLTSCSLSSRARRSSLPRSGPSPTIFSGTPAMPAGVNGEIEPLIGHERRHDQAHTARERPRRDGKNQCRPADTPQSPRDYSIGGSCPQHNER